MRAIDVILCVSAFAANAFVVSAAEKPILADRCRFEETRPIAFASWEEADKATVRIIGDTCTNATLLTTIEDTHGVIRFSHAAIFHELTSEPTDALTPKDVQDVINLVWLMLGPNRTSELLPWKEPQEFYDLFDEIPLLAHDEYEHARSADRPYICVQNYYEGADCYWITPNRGVQKLVRLSN